VLPPEFSFRQLPASSVYYKSSVAGAQPLMLFGKRFGEVKQRHISRDENLKAKVTGGSGRVKVEAVAARAHDLEATDTAIQSNGISSRWDPWVTEWFRKSPIID